ELTPRRFCTTRPPITPPFVQTAAVRSLFPLPTATGSKFPPDFSTTTLASNLTSTSLSNWLLLGLRSRMDYRNIRGKSCINCVRGKSCHQISKCELTLLRNDPSQSIVSLGLPLSRRAAQLFPVLRILLVVFGILRQSQRVALICRASAQHGPRTRSASPRGFFQQNRPLRVN